MNKGKRFLKIFVVGALCLLLLGTVTMLLWNWLVPLLFKGPPITFWQALGLFVLSKILFGSWGGGRCRNGGGPGWKNRYVEKLAAMTPEERERFKRRMSEKWCHSGSEKPPTPPASNV